MRPSRSSPGSAPAVVRCAASSCGSCSALGNRPTGSEAGISDGGLAAVLDIENVSAAAILVTADLPDEARVALIDLDPTEPGLPGKVLVAGMPNDGNGWPPSHLPRRLIN